MKLLSIWTCVVSLVLSVGAASTANDTLPTCGLLCIADFTLQSSCSLTNITCICDNAPLNAAILECVVQNCTIREQLTTQKYSKDQCGVIPRDRSTSVGVVGVTFGFLAVVAFVLRITARLNGSAGEFGMDDYVMCMAMCVLVPLCSMSVVLAKHGLGKDIWNISFDDIDKVSLLYFWDELLYLSALPLTKISILFFYLRIFPDRNFRICTFVLIGLNIGYLISFEAISIWQCNPVAGAWKKWDGTFETHCNNINLQSWMSAALNIALDLAILGLPMPELYKLALSRKKKIHIMAMFGVGLFVSIVSCLRLVSLVKFGNTTNLTQDYVDLGIWSTIEVPVGVICACMPAIRSLLRKLLPTLLHHSDSDTADSGTQLSALSKRTIKLEKSQIHVQSQVQVSSRPGAYDKEDRHRSFVQLVDTDSRASSERRTIKGDDNV